MFARDEKTEELLNGYLDGELSIEETQNVQSLLSDSPEAVRWLKEMRTLRDVFTRIPPSHLSSTFSTKVLELAAQRAAESVPSIESVQTLSKPDRIIERSPRRWAIWVGLSGLAASLLLVAYSRLPDSKPIGLIDPKADPSTVVQSSDGSLSKEIKGKNNPLENESSEPDRNAVAENSPSLPSDTGAKDTEKQPIDQVAVAPSHMTPKTAPNDAAKNSNSSPNESIVRLEPSKKENDLTLSFENVFLVVDLTVSKEAWERRSFEELLRSHDIAFESPIVVDDSIRQQLSESRFVDKNTDRQSKAPNVAIVFVRSRLTILDALITDAFRLYEDFPEFSFDMAMDPPAQEALSSVKGTQAFARADGVARPLALANQERLGLTQFVSAPRRSRVSDIETRKASRPGVSTTGLVDAQSKVDYCMFILRPKP